MAFDNLRRWWRDRGVHNDGVTKLPVEVLDEIEAAMIDMPSSKRMESVEFAKAYANLYYNGRHHEDIPAEIVQRMGEIEKAAKQAIQVDQSRAIVERLGSVEKALEHFTGESRGVKTHFELRADSNANNRGQKLAHENGVGVEI